MDVAKLYGVTTREVNQIMRNNPDKFPDGYVLTPDRKEYINCNQNSKSRQVPKAFTEKGLYMLATILKSPVATNHTGNCRNFCTRKGMESIKLNQ